MSNKTKLQIKREEAGLTIEQLAEKIHYPLFSEVDYPIENDVESIKNIEATWGMKRKMASEVLERFAEALNCSVDEIIGREQ